MRSSRRLTILVVLVALVGAACGRAEGAQGDVLEGTVVTFSAYVDDSERPAIRELISRFQRSSRAKVNVQQLSRFREPIGPQVRLLTDVRSGALVDRLKADAKAGEPSIHLFAQDNVALSELVEHELVQELGFVNAPDKAIGTLLPGRGPSGEIYFLPFRPNVRIAYARTQAFEDAGVKPPRDEDEFARAAQALRGYGRSRITLSLAEDDPAAVTLCELIVSHLGNPLVLNDAGSVAAFTFLQRLQQEGLLAPESFQAKYDTEVDNLASGRSVLAQNWPFTSAKLAKAGDLEEFTVYSGWSGPKETHVIGGDVLGIPKGVKGKQLQAAVALATFLMSRESQEYLAQENAWPSFRSDVDYRSVPAHQQSTFAAVKSALDHGWYRPVVPYWHEVSTQLGVALNAIVLQGKPVQPVLDEAHERIRANAMSTGAPYP